MLFNSLEFLVFFPLVFWIFSLLKSVGARQKFLLLASLFFYGYWKFEYLLLLVLASGVDYLAAIQLEKSSTHFRKKAWLSLSICSNLGVLAYFKYGMFLSQNLKTWHWISTDPEWLAVVLPVGISFYTFQAMGYIIDVYRGRLLAEHSYPRFLLFITFFPQLVAGPIERAPHLLAQLNQLQVISKEKYLPALGLIGFGFWKKLFLADRLAVYVDSVFNQPKEATGFQVVLATFFFGFQIYCDFSGYSDLARGIARFFGVELMVNFRRPYLSQSLSDFWRNWHISLSGWFRDYVYHPLGGNQVGQGRLMANLLLVFGLSGFWHGANWTFLLWGFWHGFGLVLERLFGLQRSKNLFYSILVLTWVFSGWLIFRANSISDVFLLVQNIGIPDSDFISSLWLPMNSKTEFLVACLGIFLLISVEKNWDKFLNKIQKLSPANQMFILVNGLILILWFGKFKGSDFIYFQF
jgi:alginate O-acetyltransferase complex protein AlgI